MIKKKVCLLGAFSVGKTSLVRHAVHSIFEERYLSTIGVKIEQLTVTVGEEDVMMMVWDIAGEEEFSQIPDSYLRQAGGCLFVADGTRPETLRTMEVIQERVHEELGQDLPSVILFNKSDLTEEWGATEDERAAIEARGTPCVATSAKLGEGVEEGFHNLAAQMLAKA